MGYRLPKFPLELDIVARIEAGNIRSSNHRNLVERGDAAAIEAIQQRRQRKAAPAAPETREETLADTTPAETPDRSAAEHGADTPTSTAPPTPLATLVPANDPGIPASQPSRRGTWVRLASTIAEAERHFGDTATWLERELRHGLRARRTKEAEEAPLKTVLPKQTRTWVPRGLACGALGAAATAAIVAASLPGRVPFLQAREARTTAISLVYSDGQMLGVVPQPDALGREMADGSVRPIAVLRLIKDIPDFNRALNDLEGEYETAGISPPFLTRALICYPFEKAGVQTWADIGLKKGRCAGGSTPLMQLSRTLRGDNSRSWFRKVNEVLDAVALSAAYPQGSDTRGLLLANGLHFGQAAGQPIYGLRVAALAAFGREPDTLELYQLAYLASLAKVPLRLSCGGGGDVANFELQRGRARKALVQGFIGDPRQADALRKLDAMQPIVHPVPLNGPLAAGLNPLGVCLAAAHPILRAELLDSTVRLAVNAELKTLEGEEGARISAVKLGFDLNSQRAFKKAVIDGLKRSRDDNWTLDPLGKKAAVLAFTSNANGMITNIYESSGTPQLDRQQRLGSISKATAMLLLARANASTSVLLCNHAWQGRKNAGGDYGKPSCTMARAMIPVVRVFGKSMSLPVNDALRTSWSSDQLASDASALGFVTDGDAASSIAFGTAKATPRQAAALLAAMSRGVADQDPVASPPRIITSYATAQGWRSPSATAVDLAAYLKPANARTFLATVARAPLLPGGTLAGASSGVLTGEIAKSGTDDLEGDTRGKYAIGAYQGRVWFAEVIPAKGVLGNGKVGFLPLVRNVRNASLGRPVN